jgi:predicted ABC-type ATPase
LNISREIGSRKKEVKGLNEIGRFSVKQHRYDLALACFLLVNDLLAIAQLPSSDEEVHDSAAQRHIDDLRKKIGDEQFKVLIGQVESRAGQIVEDVLREAR